MRNFFCLLFVLLGFGLHAQQIIMAPPAPFELNDGDTVLFLGDTFIEREQAEGYMETRLTSLFPGRKISFRNLAWSADTVAGESRAGFDPAEKGFDRLKEQLAIVKPSVVIVGYGMAHSFEGADGLEKFKTGYNRLLDTINDVSKGKNVRYVLLSPVRHMNLGGSLPDGAAHNEQLKLYTEAISEISKARKARFVSFFDLMTPRPNVRIPVMTDNGIHPNSFGHWKLAEFLERGLGLGPNWIRLGIQSDGAVRPGTTGITVTNMVRSGTNVHFEGQLTRLTSLPAPGATGTNLVYNPISRLQITGLSNGTYVLSINGAPVSTNTATEWDTSLPINWDPVYKASEELRKAIVKKNELFFHRWRPANETYLFGFRKHEQGQNAREIPMFDPLVLAEEKRIAELNKPPTLKFDLVAIEAFTNKPAAQVAAPAPKATNAVPAWTRTEQPLPQFEMGPDLEVSLFAENPNLAKPIQMNFDAQGRLWVASSEVYPQIQPGQAATDKIIVMEDTDKDGKADKSTVFAEGLLIPTGIEPGDGGVYVGNSTELLHFKDLDGDGKADTKRVVLSGFGTEDTHHILHTLRWGPEGHLYFNQSIYIHSHIETPHGVVRLNSGGILNLHPRTMELGIHMRGLVNSWGHHFDRYGQSFATDGAGGEGINWVVPQAMYFTYAGARRILGSVSPGSYPKFCGLEVVESEHFPTDWQGSIVTCDFRAHRVVRFALSEQGSGFVTKEMPDVMRTTNVTFRPIDAKVGPDGALYIADWSNPIIQHGEVDFRDPRRDHEHGRIWKVKMKNKPLLTLPDLAKASEADLLGHLVSTNGFVRQSARRILFEKGKGIMPELAKWAEAQQNEQAQLEALWMYQGLDSVQPALLEKVLSAKDGRVRAAGTRVLSFWHESLPKPLELLGKLAADPHPRVRIETMRALAKIPSARSAELVLEQTAAPMDRFQEYTAWLSINDLAKPWIEALTSGAWKTEGREKQLEYGLKAIHPEMAGTVLGKLWENKELPKDGTGPWIELFTQAGSAREISALYQQLLKDGFDPAAAKRAMVALAEASRVRKLVPEGDLSGVGKFMSHSDEEMRKGAIRLAGTWKVASLQPKLVELVSSPETPSGLLEPAFNALRDFGGGEVTKRLLELAAKPHPLPVRRMAAQTAVALDLNASARSVVDILNELTEEDQALTMWRSVLSAKGAGPIVAKAIPAKGLSTLATKAGLRAAREGGKQEPDLIAALARTGDPTDEASLSEADLKKLLADIVAHGDAKRGEMVYRRTELSCVSCHAIGGVGARVGPDMTSIGASAPLDYIVESLLFPNRKIKEGYHGILVETKDDQELSGILIRETPDALILIDATNKEVSVPKNNINKRTVSGSLMPSGLLENLKREEQLDLYRFLSELGKPGPFDAAKGNVARVWHLYPITIDVAQFGPDKMLSQKMDEKGWIKAAALVDGRLLNQEFQNSMNGMKWRNPTGVYAIAQIQVPKEGPVTFEMENLHNGAVWIDGKPLEGSKANLAAGTHKILVRLDAKTLPEFIRVRSSDGTFLTN